MLVPSIQFSSIQLNVVNKTVSTQIWKITSEKFNVLYN